MKITHTDFEQLTINSTNWKAYARDWKEQEHRFEDVAFTYPNNQPIDYNFERAYWVESYPAVMLVKAFLEALDFDYRVYYDVADDTYMITTNYGGVLE
jgi:hypothetical protein